MATLSENQAFHPKSPKPQNHVSEAIVVNSRKTPKVGIPKAGIPTAGIPKIGIPTAGIPKVGNTPLWDSPRDRDPKPGIAKSEIPKPPDAAFCLLLEASC